MPKHACLSSYACHMAMASMSAEMKYKFLIAEQRLSEARKGAQRVS